MNRTGWAHLREQLHVLMSVNDKTKANCHQRLNEAVSLFFSKYFIQYF
jgi:hypothetical protein